MIVKSTAQRVKKKNACATPLICELEEGAIRILYNDKRCKCLE